MSEAGMRYLFEALKAGSMRAAGDKLNVAASSISRQISQLEARLGVGLIEKGRRGICLTQAGQLVIDHYRNQLADREALQARLEDLRAVRSGTATLAVGEGFLGKSFTQMLGRFSRDNPEIELEIMTGSTQEIVRMVTEDEAHMGLVFQTPHDLKVRVRATIAQPLMAIMRPDHRFASFNWVSIADLASEALCLAPPSFRLRQILAVAETASNLHLEPVITTNSINVMQEAVRSGIALTILPQVSVWSELEEGSMISVPIENEGMQGASVSLILRSGRQLEGAPMRLLQKVEAQLQSWNRQFPAPE